MWARRTPFCSPAHSQQRAAKLPRPRCITSVAHLEHVTRLFATEVAVPLPPRKHVLQAEQAG